MIWFVFMYRFEIGLVGGSVFKCCMDLIYKIYY